MTGDQASDGESPGPTIVDVAGDAGSTWAAVLARLAAHAPAAPRYSVKGEIARGGMGVIFRCQDENLKRPLAMKVMLARAGDEAAPSGTPRSADDRSLGRFLEEAQVTGQLDHPGIVPVHELGLDPEGRVYFTMKLVKGQDLRKVFDLVHAEEPAKPTNEGWNLVRALNVLLRVCEAMSYAHAKGVVHRDLKPGNVMVGKFGEVYVMDWGLARVLGAKDTKDLRLKDAPKTQSLVASDRRAHGAQDALDSPLLTMDGEVVGTPSYMPPEQAMGFLDEVGPHSDVYAVGAMLYHLLTGCMPYVNPGARLSPRTILAAVTQGPPRPVDEAKRGVPAELVAICDKAMARRIADRYPTMLDLAGDLRAVLEQRVVSAYETGAFAELKKWVLRNQALAATAAVALLAVLGLAWWALQERRIAQSNEALAKSNAVDAAHNAAVAEERAANILRLADVKRLDDLRVEMDALWPPLPDEVAALESSLGRAHELLARLPVHEATLAELAPLMERGIGDTESRWWHDTLAALVGGLHALAADDPFGPTVRSVEQRLEFARTIRQRSIDEERPAWERCISGVAADPRYGGLALAPQLGLVPLGADPESGLQEFWHVQSGARPVRGADGQSGADGSIVVDEDMGIVLVLIPGGTYRIGAQSADPDGPHFDPLAKETEAPVHDVLLEPYFLSKYEMTQGQWLRATGANPSMYGPHQWMAEWSYAGMQADLSHPVEEVSWNDCTAVLARLDLVLPTEVQWEAACRAGTDTPWWTGSDLLGLAGAANLADQYGKEHGVGSSQTFEMALFDGWTVHARVGTFRPNAFGLLDVTGNVWEWCRDGYGGYDLPARDGDGERLVPNPADRVDRGGSFLSTSRPVRSAHRHGYTPESSDHNLGCRPARAMD